MPVQKNERVFDFYQLEDRILLSADGLDAGDAPVHRDVEFLDALMGQMLESGSVGASDALFGVDLFDSADAAPDQAESNDRVDTPTFDPSRPLEVVFVDAGVEDAETLLAGLRDNSADGTQWSIVRLSSDEDGITQISQTLGNLSGVDAIHILSHGDGDGIQLGDTRLDQDTAIAHAGSIAGWQNALDADADLLIYGCDLASTDSGRELIEMLAAVCDCDVAASDDLTGHQSLGGDWDLEYAVGSIETQVAFDSHAQHAWQHVFAAAVDATSTGTSSGSDFVVSHTTSGSDRLMLVGVSINLAGADQVSSITYNGDSLSLVGTRVDGDARVEIWSLVAPDVGTYNVDINFSGTSDGNTAGVMTFTGVDKFNPLGTFASGSGVGGSGSVTVSSATDDLVFAAIAVDDATDYDLVPGAGQTETWDLIGGPDINGGGSSEAGAASVVMDWTWSGSDNWAAAGVSINSMSYESTSFREGVGGYTGTQDTSINGDSPDTSYGNDGAIAIDADHVNGFESAGLIQFDNIFGNGPGQIPLGSTIVSASLTVNGVGTSDVGATLSLHEMLTAWDESSTFNSLGSGLQSGTEYVAAADGSITDLSTTGWYTITGLEDALQTWSDGGTNHGWALFNDNSNGFDFDSSEEASASLRPELSVQYLDPVAPVGSSIEGSTLAYTENDGAIAITSTLALSDSDDTDLQSAVVQITGNYANGQDVLTFVDQNGISGVWNAGSGTLTLSGTATVAQYQASLRSITYTNASDNPSTATRTVAFTVNDGNLDSNTQTRDISIAATNDDPTGTGLPSDITVTEDVSGNVDLSALNLSDVDENGGNLTVTLSTSTGGNLSASSGGGVTVGSSGTGTLTLTGTLADLNTFLDTPANVQYLHGTPHTFGNDADTIQVVVNDGGNTGSGGGTDQTIGTVNVDIGAVNDSATISGLAGDNSSYTAGDGAVLVEQGGNGLVSDADSANFDGGSLTIAFLPGGDSAEDVLSIRNEGAGAGQIGFDGTNVTYQGVLIGTATGGAGGVDLVIALNVNATPTALSALINKITYENTDTTSPTPGARGVRFVLNDGDGATSLNYDATVNLPGVDTATILDRFGTVAYSNNDGTVNWTGDWVESDSNGGDAASGRFSVRDSAGDLYVVVHSGGDNLYREADLSNTTSATLSLNYDNKLGGAATLHLQVSSNGGTNYTTVAVFDATTNQSVGSQSIDITSYASSNTRIRFYVVAGETGAAQNKVSIDDVAIDYTYNTDPVLLLPGTAINYTENDGPVVVDATSTVSDAQNVDFDSGVLTVDFTAGSTANDRLAIRHEGAAAGQVGVSGTDVTYAGITIGSFTGGSDGGTPLTVTFNASADEAAVEAVVRNITYANISENPSTATRTVRFVLTDGDGGSSTAVSEQVNVSAVNDAPAEAGIEPGTLAYTENDGAVAITSTLTLSDVDDTDLESAVVQITGNYTNGEDVLSFVDQNGISGVWNAGSGTMTLSGTATVAQYEAALRSITYSNTSDNPSTSTRTVAFTVNDGDVDSNTQTRDISIAATNDDPTGAGLPSDITVTEDVSSDVDLSALNLADLDDNGGNLTVTLSTSTGGDLSASTGGGVTVGGSGTGTLTLTGSLADLNTFLDTPANIQYLHGTPHTFGNDADTIQVVVNDGGNTGSGGGTDQTIGTVNVDITAVNDEQVLSTNAGDTVSEGSTGNTVTTAMLETTDVDNTDSQLVYTLDVLPSNGTLYRSGVVLNVSDTFTQADIDAGLITYDHDGTETTSDSFDFTVDDGAGTTTSSTFNWTVTAGNDAPIEASIEGSTLAYTENDGAVAITSTLALSDVDDTNLESAVVQITGNYANGQDVLTFVDQNGISGVWNAGSGTLTLTGTATVAQYEAALRSITYTNNSDNPSTLTRTVAFTVNDGDVDSNTQTRDISIAATNDDPTGTGLPTDIAVTEDVSSNVDLSALNLADLDDNGGNLTVTLSTSTGGDLSASTGGGVTVGGSGTGTLTLTGSLADLNTFLDTPANIQYLHGTPHTFGNDADTIQVVVNDGGNTGSGGGTDQTIGTVNVDITAVNDEQVLATNTGDTVPEGSVGNTVTTAMLETTDVDNTDSQLVYTVDAVPTNGTLYRLGSALSVSDTFTQADIDAGLITYDHDGSQTSSDSFDFTVDDGAGTTTSSTCNWTVTNVNDAPVEASIEGSTLAYTENDGAVAITSTLALSDVDDTNLESAVVQISGNYANGQDVLTFVDQNGVSGVWNAGSGTLTLTGTATVAEYQTALRSITYANTSDNPSTATRTVAFTVNDGDVDSNTQTRDISIAATNDDPTGTGLPTDIAVTEDVSSNVDLSALNLSDLDENGGNLTVTLSTSTGGDLSASTGGGVTVGGSGTGTLTLTGSLADLNTFLDTPANIQYLHGTPHTFGNDADTIQVIVNDGGNTGSGGGTDQTIGTVNVDITAVNDEQVLSTNAGDTVSEGSTGNTVTTAMLETTDVDNTDSQLVYTLDVLPSNGTLYRSGVVLNVSDTFTQADIDAGLITYDHDGTETTSDSFDFTVDDGAGTTTSSTFNWTVTAGNDAPIEASIEGSTLAYTENDGAVAITSTLALSDVDDTNLESAVVQISGNYANGQDVLTFVDQNGIIGVWNAGSGTLTLTGTATVAEYQTALRSITYANTSDNPSTATRTVSFTVNDGDVDSNTQTRDISIAATNDDPTGTGLPSDITVTEDVSSNVDLSALNLADLDENGGNLTVTLSTSTGGDLSASTGGGVTVGGSGTGTLTLTGTLADLNTFLDTPANIQYLHGTPHTFGNDADTIQVVVNDGGNTGSGGGTDQTIGTVNVDITAVNDEQVVSTNTGVTVAEGSTGNVLFNTVLGTTDVDHSAAQLIYTVDALPTNGTLYRNAVVLNVSDTFTQSDIDAGLISYDHDGTSTTSDSFDFTVDDGVGSTTSSTFNWTISGINDAPVASSIEASPLVYTENAGAVAITASLSLADVDDTNLESAIVQISGNYDSGEDLLSFTDQNGITGSWDSGTARLTLTGTATVAQYEAALRSITYTNSSDDPSAATRTVAFTINDGDVNSNTQTRDIAIAATNDDPTGAGLPSDVAVTEDVSSNVDLSALNLADLDDNGGNLTVTLSTSTGGDLSASTGGGVTVGGSGTGTLTLTGTLADLNTFLDTPANIQYLHGTPHTFSNDADTIQVIVNDGGNTGSGGGTDQTIGTVNVDITAVNDSPNLTTNSGMTVAEGATGVAITPGMLSGSDVDDASTGLTYTLTDDVDNGTLTLAGFGTLTLGDTFTQADLDNGDVTYSHDDSETAGDGFGFTLADGGEDGASAIAGTFTITVTPVNDNAISAIADVDPSANSVAEDAVSGTLVGITALASDADAGASVTYSLDDDAGGRFSIETTTGIVRVAGALDHETSASEIITIRATSSDGSTTTMTNSIAVTDVNEAPAATGEAFTVTIGETLSVGVAGVIFNDTDIDGDTLAIVLVAAPTNGTFSLDPGGNFTYTPNAGFFGQDTFFYRVTDGTLSSNVAEVVLEVPVAAPVVSGSGPTPAGDPDSEQPETENAIESDADTSSEVEPESDESTDTSEATVTSGEDSGIALASVLHGPGAKSDGGVGGPSDGGGLPGNDGLPDEVIQAERQLYGVYAVSSDASSVTLSHAPELQQLERLLRQDLQQAIVWTQWDDPQEQEDDSPMTVMVGAAGAGMSVFSIGYVFWALRGGALMTVFASSLPAWRFIDPIAMLSAYRSSRTGVDEGLDSMLG